MCNRMSRGKIENILRDISVRHVCPPAAHSQPPWALAVGPCHERLHRTRRADGLGDDAVRVALLGVLQEHATEPDDGESDAGAPGDAREILPVEQLDIGNLLLAAEIIGGFGS